MSEASTCCSGPAVKICGLTREQDVHACIELDIEYTGFIFVPASPRYIEPAAVARMPVGRGLRVGVFSGQSRDTVLRIMEDARLDLAQLHGKENPEFCRAIGAERVIKVLWPEQLWTRTNTGAETGVVDILQRLEAECEKFTGSCAFFLLDAGVAGGGSGKTLAWSSLRDFAPLHPWFLAGGLGPDNAAKAYSECRPFGLDCNSGVEETAGHKDPGKIMALIASLNRNDII